MIVNSLPRITARTRLEALKLAVEAAKGAAVLAIGPGAIRSLATDFAEFIDFGDEDENAEAREGK